jgi:asparagine synthetase B (glutamine-hydrolysing)
MGDIYIDLRKKEERKTSSVTELMQYYKDIQVKTIEFNNFSLVQSFADDQSIWGPFESPDEKIFVALAGRVAFEEQEWDSAERVAGDGGLACKGLYSMYLAKGIHGLYDLNGSFVVFIYDRSIEKAHIIIDRCGMFPFYGATAEDGNQIFASHADILAKSLDRSRKWDLASMAEFLITGKVMFPNTYYQDIKALESGCSYSIDMGGKVLSATLSKRYFSFKFNTDHSLTKVELAEELATAFKKAVKRRTGYRFGQSAVSLSGGLDSRALLFAADRANSLWAFCFHDEENYEFNVAKEVALAADVKFIPLKRDIEYYGNNIEMGVKISGGTGNIFNNHYLGFRDEIRSLGIDNIIAGFYCDRLFKGYVLNKKVSKFLRTVKLTDFKFESNQRYIWPKSEHAVQVQNRLNEAYGAEMRADRTNQGKLIVENKRIFPLYSESENPTTIIPQRVMGWFLPSVDTDILNVYLKTPVSYKLHPSMYSLMVEMVCGKTASKIDNVSTGTRVNPSKFNLVINSYRRALQRRVYRLKGTIATDESWPDWLNYVHNSKKIKSLWRRETNKTRDLFSEILGVNPYSNEIQDFKATGLDSFLRLITLKIWFEHNA